ncbi:MAG: cytochrome c, partial [Gammaproteobacteria bacterium]
MPVIAMRILLTILVLLSAASQAQQQTDTADPAERGRYLATVGNCKHCHSVEGGAAFAGGAAFSTDFGVIYSTNITPDPAAGIGTWTLEQFTRAMREGIAADGTKLYPAFPYPSFTKITDGDLKDIFAYLQTVAPTPNTPPENDMSFPFSQRSLMGVWNKLFLDNARFAANESKSAEWNRGAYLVQGLGHCGSCHTPRNALGAEQADRALSGGTYNDEVEAGMLRPWSAVNLTSAPDGLAAWSVDDIRGYLS